MIITDHDTIHGSIEAKKYVKSKNYDLVVPVAAEFLTDAGDIIGFNLSKNFKLRSKDVNNVLDQIKKSGGITVLPHPFDNHDLEKIDFDLVDFIEVFNSRSTIKNNKKSFDLAKKLSKKMIYGSDAHFIDDISNVIIENLDIKNSQIQCFHTKYTPRENLLFSQLIKSIKKFNFKLMVRISLKIIIFYANNYRYKGYK